MRCAERKFRWLLVDPFTIISIAVVFLLGAYRDYLWTLLCIFLHEAGHMTAARLMGMRIYQLKILPVGFNASIEESACNAKNRIILYISGPMINILLSIICMLLKKLIDFNAFDMHFFIEMNLFLAVFNLMPVMPLDGGRILREILLKKKGIFGTHNTIKHISQCIAVGMMMIGILQICFSRTNFSILLLGVYLWFVLRPEEMEAAIMNIKNIVYRRSRILKKRIYPARHLVAVETVKLGEIIKSMDFDNFHFIQVVDEGLGVLGVFTEQEVLDAILELGNDITFGEFVRMKGKQD